ncbi:MAG: DUF2867 domain-containing protein [Nitrospinota bacterium]|nr:DUF2867 domain-containing protein [Nitrospinota bacterium]
MEYSERISDLKPLFNNADHIDIKKIEGTVSLDHFIASMLSYMPWWLRFLYRLRAYLVRLLGMRQGKIEFEKALQPEDISFKKGKKAFFFTVKEAKEDSWWFAEATDKHLTAYLGAVAEPLGGENKRFHVITIVHYRHWTGPVYFNIIRPFHHLVVSAMARAGIKNNP